MSSRIIPVPLSSFVKRKLTWPMKGPGDELPFGLDATDFLDDGGLVLVEATCRTSAGLTAGTPEITAAAGVNTGVLILLGAGIPDAVSQVLVTLNFADGSDLVLLVSLPIGSAIPDGLVGPPDPIVIPDLPPPGPGVSEFVFQQPIPASVWTIVHRLNRYPPVVVLTSAGDLVEGSVAYPDADTIVLTFSAPFAGSAHVS